jgi:hypothetical protein
MSAHTPGPWTQDKYGNVLANGEGLLVSGVCLPNGVHPRRGEAEANARLIASAPDLLKHLRELVEIVDAAISAGDWKVDGCCDPSLSLDWARAAIAKAEGRA